MAKNSDFTDVGTVGTISTEMGQISPSSLTHIMWSRIKLQCQLNFGTSRVSWNSRFKLDRDNNYRNIMCKAQV